MNKNKLVKIALSTTLMGSTFLISPLSSSATTDNGNQELEVSVDQYAQENNLIYNETTVVTYNALGQEISEVVTEEAVTEEGEVILEEITEEPTITPVSPLNSSITSPGYGTYAVINPGGINYKLIDTFKGDSRIVDTASKWVAEFGAAVIPFKFLTGFWKQSAGVATANTFLPEFSTKYYTTYVYEDQDYYNYYGKSVSKQYSNSARTKLTKTSTHVSRLPK